VCRGGAQERYGVVPDLCTLGKVPAGGFPMAMIAGKRRFMDAFNGLGQSALPQVGTFNGHPIAAVSINSGEYAVPAQPW
jgi:glutamate-1-semialdehyde 2,1-aminomutase